MKPRPLGRIFELILATLREIFDEAAYARFLQAHHLVGSRAAYAAFLAGTREQRERKPRCC